MQHLINDYVFQAKKQVPVKYTSYITQEHFICYTVVYEKSNNTPSVVFTPKILSKQQDLLVLEMCRTWRHHRLKDIQDLKQLDFHASNPPNHCMYNVH